MVRYFREIYQDLTLNNKHSFVGKIYRNFIKAKQYQLSANSSATHKMENIYKAKKCFFIKQDEERLTQSIQ